MANEQNLMPIQEVNSRRTREQHSADSRKAGIASGEARRRKKTMRETLEMLLDEKYKKTGKTYREEATIGLLKGAIWGNAKNYEVILDLLGELRQAEEEKANKEMSKVEELLSKIKEEANDDTKR